MKKIGFGGLAEATTLNGEVTLPPAMGLDTVSGKSFDPLPHAVVEGLSAVGAGNKLVLGDHVIATGGVEGNEGCVGGGVGGGVGLVGLVGVVVFELAPQPTSARLSAVNVAIPDKVGILRNKMNTARILSSRDSMAALGIQDRERRTDWCHQYVQAFKLVKL